jgi:hypothetical protein
MKNNKFTMMILTFIIGAVVGGGITGGVWYSMRPASITLMEGVREISIDTARLYYLDYLKKNPLIVDTLRYITLNMEQLNAMNMLLEKKPDLKGFRLYMGIVGDPTDVTIVVGRDEDGSDCSTTPLYTTDREGSGPCPPSCDKGVSIKGE